MTIAPETFAMGMTLLAERFARGSVPSHTMQGIYFEQLDAELTDDEFLAGVKLCIRDLEHYPRIGAIIERARPTSVQDATVASGIFDAIVARPEYEAGERGNFYSLASIDSLHGEAARLAIQDAGGVARLLRAARHDSRDLAFMRRDFVAAFAERRLVERSAARLATVSTAPAIGAGAPRILGAGGQR